MEIPAAIRFRLEPTPEEPKQSEMIAYRCAALTGLMSQFHQWDNIPDKDWMVSAAEQYALAMYAEAHKQEEGK